MNNTADAADPKINSAARNGILEPEPKGVISGSQTGVGAPVLPFTYTNVIELSAESQL